MSGAKKALGFSMGKSQARGVLSQGSIRPLLSKRGRKKMVCKSPINVFRLRSNSIPEININTIYSCKDKKYNEETVKYMKYNDEWKAQYFKLRTEKNK